MTKAFNFAAKAGIVSFAILLCLGLCVGVLDYLLGPKHVGKLLIIPQVVGFLAALVWLVCTLLVWVEGWIFITEGLRSRSWPISVLLVLALVFFNVLAAYIFHFVRRSFTPMRAAIPNTTV